MSERDDALSALDSARRQLFGSVLAMPVLLLIAVLTPLEDVAIAGFLYCCFTFLKARRVRESSKRRLRRTSSTAL